MSPDPVLGFAVLIPARYASERLPGKMLLAESGMPLICHVETRARGAGAARVLVLTDDARIVRAVEASGGAAVMTDPAHGSGTDRCAEVAATLTEDVVVNVQGDEPLFAPSDLAALAGAVEAGADIATLGYPFSSADHLLDPHAVKAVVAPDGTALDFLRDGRQAGTAADAAGAGVFHHVGIYAFRRDRLLASAAMDPSPREQSERLEQLRALEAGWRIQVLPASAPAFGIDTRADYDAFLATL